MRPDQLTVFVLFSEAQRLVRTPAFRRFKPAFVIAVDKLLCDLPKPVAVPVDIKPLAELYRENINSEDVVEACKDFGVSQHTNALVALLTEVRLHAAYDSLLSWNEYGDVTATCGETHSALTPMDIPFQNGKLHGVISYGTETYEFHQGFRLPKEPLSAEVIDRYHDEEAQHRSFVELFGVEAYLRGSKLATRVKDNAIVLISTDRFAIIDTGDRVLRAPPRFWSLEDAKRWLKVREEV